MSFDDELDVNAPDFTHPQSQEAAEAPADFKSVQEQPKSEIGESSLSDRQKKITAVVIVLAFLGFMAWFYTRTNSPTPVNPPHFKPAVIK